MSLSYYDETLGTTRMKRRYKWALWAFVAGTFTGALLFKMF